MDERLRFLPIFLVYYCFSLCLIAIIALFVSDAYLLYLELGMMLFISAVLATIFCDEYDSDVKPLKGSPALFNVVIYCVDWSEYRVNERGLSLKEAFSLSEEVFEELADSSLVLIRQCFNGDSASVNVFVKSNIVHISMLEVQNA